MKTDGLLTITRITHTIRSASDALTIIPIGDVHRDSKACDVERWKSFLRDCKRRDQSRVLYVGMGDWLDLASRSEKKALDRADLHDTSRERMDRLADADLKELACELQFTRGRWVGMLEGNHGWRFQDGSTTGSRLAAALDAPLLGSLAYVTVSLISRGYKRSGVDMVLTHGRAGGKLAGTTISQVADLRTIFPAADIYIMGHDHQRGAWPQSMLHVSQGSGTPTLHCRRQWLCRSGSFLRAYAPGMSSYAAGSLLRPADLGTIELEVRLHRSGAGGRDVSCADVRAIA